MSDHIHEITVTWHNILLQLRLKLENVAFSAIVNLLAAGICVL